MDFLDVFRVEPDGSFTWIGSADSLDTAREIIKSSTVGTTEDFLIYDAKTNERLALRADGHSVRSTC
jgi:hypothetical protein